MSQHRAKAADGRFLIWGYDRPLDEYFFQAGYTPEEKAAMPDDDDSRTAEYKFAIGHSVLTPHPDFPNKLAYSTGEILELMEPYPEIPDAHKTAMAMGLPF